MTATIPPSVQATPIDHALPAGGPDPAKFDWKEAWYPVHYVADLDPKVPTPFTLLGEDIVLWWEQKSQTWHAMADQCPHRLAPLSQGRIAEDGLLECPYHGWAFAGDGTCDRIPQQLPGSNGETSPRACVRSYPTTVAQGLLFVYAGTPSLAPRVTVPIIEPMTIDPDAWLCFGTFRDLPYDALTLLENVLDASHIPFTHHKTIGNRQNAAPVELEVLTAGKQGFTGVWPEGPRKGKLGTQHTQFIAPNLMWHDLTSVQLGRTMTVVYATPTRPGQCRLFARFPFKLTAKLPAFFIKLTPRWYSHIGQNGILEDDQVFIYYQERYLAARGGSHNFAKAFYLATRADLFVTEFRKWVNEYAGLPLPPAQDLDQRPTTEALVERYHSHTSKCASCRQALQTIKKVRLGLVISLGLLWLGFPLFSPLISALWLKLLWIGGALSGAAVWLYLGKLESEFYHGRTVLPRNLSK